MDTWMGRNHDPITLHKYLYVGADPVSYVDYSGQSFTLSGTMKAVKTIGTVITMAVAAHDIYGYASGDKELTVKNIGWTAIMIFAGSSGKVISYFQSVRAARYFAAAVESGSLAKLLIKTGRTSETLLRKFIPSSAKNIFVSNSRIKAGFKYKFEVAGKKIEIKWHSRDLLEAMRRPESNSGSGWTAQIKIDKKLLGLDGKLYSNPNNLTHIPIDI